MNVLAVAAHPDDEVLGCGGTLSRLAARDHEVHIVILGEGVTSRYRKREEADRELVAALQAQSRQASNILGAKDLSMHEFPDNRFDTVPLLDVVKTVEEAIEGVQPEVIYTHHAGDLNVDHQIVHRAVLTATRPIAERPVRDVYAFEVPSSTEWAFGGLSDPFQPNVFEDISETLSTKLRAFAAYASEIRPAPHPRSAEVIEAIARRWGSVAGCEAAEAFALVRSIRIRGR